MTGDLFEGLEAWVCPDDFEYDDLTKHEDPYTGMRLCGHCGDPLPAGSRPHRRFCSDACKLKAHRRRHDPQVGSRPRGRPGPPLWLTLLADTLVRRQVKVNGRWLRPYSKDFGRWLAAALLMNDDLPDATRRSMTEIAQLSEAEVRRLERRVTRLENTLADFAAESGEAARKVSARLERTRALINERVEQSKEILDRRSA